MHQVQTWASVAQDHSTELEFSFLPGMNRAPHR
jgi:hypothetical protein